MARPPFVQLPKAILARADLTLASKVVYAVIVDKIGKNSDAWPGLRSLARELNMSTGGVYKATRQLEKEGLLIVTRVGRNDALESNRYSLPDVSPCDTSKADDVSQDDTGVSQGDTSDVSQGERDVSQGEQNKTQLTRPKTTRPKKKGADPWKQAQSAMTSDVLRTDRFQETWTNWVGYRRDIKRSLTARTVKMQIKKLEGFGHDRAITAIEQSIEQGWQGFFEPKSGAGTPRQPTPLAEQTAAERNAKYRK